MPPRPNSDIGVVLSPTPRETVRRGRTFTKWDFRTYGEHLETLSGLRDGFQWYSTVVEAPAGAPSISGVQRRIEFGYPRFGRTFLETGFIWEYPGNALSYSWSADADKSATAAYVLGSGEGDLRSYAVLYNQQRLRDGWPLLDVSYSHSTVTRRATLESHAAKYLRAFDPPVGEFDLTVHPDLPPTFGPPGTEQYFMGDEIGVKIDDEIFGGSDVRPEDLYVVIGGISVTPNDDGIEDVKPEISIKSRDPYIGPDEEDEFVEDRNPTPEVDTGDGSEAGARRYYSTTRGASRAYGSGGWGGSRP